jgi:hypothetical protein
MRRGSELALGRLNIGISSPQRDRRPPECCHRTATDELDRVAIMTG